MLDFAKVTGGVWFDYLKDVILAGRVRDDGEFYIFGCHEYHEEKFYKGIYEADKILGVEGMGFESPEAVEEFWKDPDFFFIGLEKGSYVTMSNEEVEKELPLEEEIDV